MPKFGIKEISESNWLEPDAHFFMRTSEGEVKPMRGEDWLPPILKPKLLDTVPTEVQRLFEVARGAMVYGYFFYPLYTLAVEQLARVTEAAVMHKCKALNAPPGASNFKRGIDWLKNQGIISASDADALDSIRELRNIASHPSDQSIYSPGMAIPILEYAAERINSLYAK